MTHRTEVLASGRWLSLASAASCALILVSGATCGGGKTEHGYSAEMGNLKFMVGCLLRNAASGGAVALDRGGRLDVYSLVDRGQVTTEEAVGLFWSEFQMTGPTAQEIRARDYSQFPYGRFKGRPDLWGHRVPLLWFAPARDPNKCLVAYCDGYVACVSGEQLDVLLQSCGQAKTR